MTILLLIPALSLGGAQRRVISLVRGLKARGHEVGVTVFFPPDDEEHSFAGDLDALGVKPHTLGPAVIGERIRTPSRVLKLLRSVGRFRKHVRDFKPDVIHSFLPSANIFTATTLRTLRGAARPRHVMGREGLPVDRILRPRIAFLEDVLSRYADQSVCVCRAIRDETRRGRWWRPANKLEVILNGIDTVASKVERETVAGSPLRCIVVSNLWPRKGHRDLLKALRILKDQGYGEALRITCVGADWLGLQFELEREVSRYGLDRMVEFVGPSTEIRGMLAASDFYLSASHGEGLSIAMMEAMAAGLPILATRVGGTPELLDPSFSEMVEPQDPKALALGLERFLGYPRARLVEMGRAARAHCEGGFTVDRMVKETEAMYYDLVAENPSTMNGKAGVS